MKTAGSSRVIDLIGDVQLKHNNVLIMSDKARWYKETNTIDAKGNVRVKKGSMTITGASLLFDGNKQIGKFRKNVELNDEGKTLTTDFLDFNSANNSGQFFNGGKVEDSTMVLTSKKGEFFPDKKIYIFRDSIVVKSDNYTMYSDTLRYDLAENRAYVTGPTRIIEKDSRIYCEGGWYNTEEGKALFTKNASIKSNEQHITGDSLFYDRKSSYGRAIGNVSMHDTVENVILKGKKAIYYDDFAQTMLTGDALFIQISEADSLFLHADTLVSNYDSTGTNRILKAYYHAKIYRKDLQAKSDSIEYSFGDSVVNLYKEPVLWTENNQVTAKHIAIHTKNNRPDFLVLKKSAFIASQEDSVRFNQIKGKEMVGYFRNNDLYLIDVKEEGKSVYFTKDNDKLIGVNKAECQNMKIYLHQNKVKKIIFLKSINGTLHPMDNEANVELKLSGFNWYTQFRPKNKQDIFIWENE